MEKELEVSGSLDSVQASEVSATKTLKRVLGRADLMSIAVGQIIGAGVFALTGIVIGVTGRSTNLAFMLAAIIVTVSSIPSILIGGTIRMNGGQYTQAALFLGKKFSGFYMFIYIITNVSIAMYAVSFAQYAVTVLPGLAAYSTMIAFGVLTVFYLLNLFGIQGAAKIQNLMVVLMAAALALFIGFGILKVQPGYFAPDGWMTGGIMGLLTGTALLQYATGGASVVVNFGAEAKNPTKDIPFVIIVSTVGVAFVYGLMATVAAGVLPLDVVAYQPLTEVAKAVLPTSLMYFFIICGAGFALTTTLNATLGWVTKPLLQATIDGWFPKALGAVNEKYKTPHVWLTIIYVMGAVTIFTGADIGSIANFALVLFNILSLVMAFSVVMMPKVIPALWAKSKFHVSNPMLYLATAITMAASLFQIIILGLNQTNEQLIGNAVILVLASVYAYFRSKYVVMEVSHEES